MTGDESPLVVAVEMGYGHLRAAAPLAERLGVEILHCDRPPLADVEEQKLWQRARTAYEFISRVSQVPVIGGPLRKSLEALTAIPHLHPYRDLSRPTAGARFLDSLVQRGLGRGLADELRRSGRALLTTFFAPAIACDAAGARNLHCVVTDSDVNRAWAPVQSRDTKIQYYAPSLRVVRRLASYGVPESRIVYSGFPLPHELLGGPQLPVLRENLAARLVRLDPRGAFRDLYRDELDHFLGPLPTEERRREAPHVVFAVGGAGAQADLARRFLPGMARALRQGALQLTLVAGLRREVEAAFRAALDEAHLRDEPSVAILIEDRLEDYFLRFNQLLASADLVWTKPSEMTFFAALGLPLVFAPPIGVHEVYNRRWAVESGAGFEQRDPRFAAEWIADWLDEGALAAAAWSGFMRLPKFGLYRILDELSRADEEQPGEPLHLQQRS